MELRPVGSKLFYVGARTDRHDEAKILFTVLETRLKSHFSLRYITVCVYCVERAEIST
jgi:hypothetical protein